jgi:hypothetical protein
VPDLGLAEARVLGGDGEIAGQRHARAGADRVAVERRDHRLALVPDLEEELEIRAHQRFELVERRVGDLLHVPAGAEGALAGAGEHDRADAGIGRERVERPDDLAVGDRHAQRVQAIGPVDPDLGDRPACLDDDVLVFVHACPFPWRRPASRRGAGRESIFHLKIG